MPQTMPQTYPEKDWESLTPCIVQWYFRESKTLRQVTEELSRRGYHVTQKMIRGRLRGFGRKNSTRAIDLTAVTSNRDASSALHLQHGQCHFETTRDREANGVSFLPASIPAQRGSQANRDDWSYQVSGMVRTGSPRMFLQDPVQVLYDQNMTCIHAYCRAYVGSESSQKHSEPQRHRETVHARFAHNIQDGIALWRRKEVDLGLKSVQEGFSLLGKLLDDHHPMSLALVMTVICDLTRLEDTRLHEEFFHSKDLLEMQQGSHPWATIFDGFRKAPHATMDIALRCMRIAKDQLSSLLGRGNWKTLYLEERLCDSLYYAGIDHERIEARKNLLRDQESLYGLYTNNVLWTLTNVAEDRLQLDQFDESAALYKEALERAEAHKEFDRAKTRVAALEGLANAHISRVGLVRWPFETWSPVRSVEEMDQDILRSTSKYLGDAEREAQEWFGENSRRVARIREKLRILDQVELEFFVDFSNCSEDKE